MTVIQRSVLFFLSRLSLTIGIAWLFFKSSFESWLFVISGFIGLFTHWWLAQGKSYASKRLIGPVVFNYSNNNGQYAIEQDELLFETVWSKASDASIRIHKDSPSINTLVIALNVATLKI